MNDDDRILRYDETRDASRMRERNENSKRMLRKINHEIKRNNKKTEKNDRKNERHN